jgi:hypothetical protein
VGALRAHAADVDTTPRRYGAPVDEAEIDAARAQHAKEIPHRS